MQKPRYMLVGGVPIVDGPGFLTPVFASRNSNALWYQDIKGFEKIVGFIEVPAQAARRVKSIGAICEKAVGEVPIFCFSDEDAIFHIDTLRGLHPELVGAFWRLEEKKHLRKTIAYALKDRQLIREAERDFGSNKNSINEGQRRWPITAEIHSKTELGALDLGLHKDVFVKLLSGANALLVGPRGSGKTFMLRKLKQQLEDQGKNIVFVQAGASSQPLLISLALACSLHVEGGGGFRRKIRNIAASPAPISQADIDDLIDILRASSRGKGAVDTIIIDDVYAFDAGSTNEFPVSDNEILGMLMRDSGSKIVASTSHILGYQNLFRRDAFSPMEGHDYQSFNLDVTPDPTADRKVIDLLLQKDESLSDMSEVEKVSLTGYLYGINIRRKLEFLARFSRVLDEFDTVVAALESTHEESMLSLVDQLMNAANGRITKREFHRQSSGFVEKIEKQYELAKKSLARVGRTGSVPGPLPFSVNWADDVTLIAAMLQNGTVHLDGRDQQSLRGETRVTFANKFDEDWFVSRFRSPNDPTDDDGQYQLF